MPDSIPPILSPYLSPAPQGSLTLITSVLDAVPNWLLLRYVHAALHDTVADRTHGGGDVLPSHTGSHRHENFNVIFVSVLRGFEQWREMGKRVGLDFAALVTTKRLFYVNGLIEPPTPPNPQQQNANMVTLDLSSTHDLETVVRRYAEHGKDGGHESKTIVIMDGLDFLLASRPSFTNLTLSRTVMTLRQYVHNVIVTCSADYPLLHNPFSSAAPLEAEHRAFVTTIAHQSQTVVQLRSLGTGAARDITGVLRVSAGGAYDESNDDDVAFEDAEWLYQVRGDGSVRIWGRGE